MTHDYQIDAAAAGKRLDHFLKLHIAERSRAQLQEWIKDGKVLVNDAAVKAGHVLKLGDRVMVTPVERPGLTAQAEDLPVTVLYEDDAVIAVNKAAGVVVHAGAGVRDRQFGFLGMRQHRETGKCQGKQTAADQLQDILLEPAPARATRVLKKSVLQLRNTPTVSIRPEVPNSTSSPAKRLVA